jgi:pre-mRNA-splicing factor ATP-dependent RNA helicase DHX15/PRP43
MSKDSSPTLKRKRKGDLSPKERSQSPEKSAKRNQKNGSLESSTSPSHSKSPIKQICTESEGKSNTKPPVENPYLAHRQPNTRMPPLFEKFIPGCTTSKQAIDLEDGEINPFTGRPFSKRYKTILEKRRVLPVSTLRDDFLEMFQKSQAVVLEGETGSGKTTQYVFAFSSSNTIRFSSQCSVNLKFYALMLFCNM